MISIPLLLLAISSIHSIHSSPEMSSSEEQNEYKTVSNSCNSFSNKLYKALALKLQDNIATSPFSLHMILSVLSNGANGHTLDEFKTILHHDNGSTLHDEFKSLISVLNDTKEVELHVANVIYLHEEFPMSPDFLSVSKNIFECLVSSIDFKNNVNAADTINSWVREATKTKITNILMPDDISADTRVVLVNAVYFKGFWLDKFDVKLTEKKAFHVTRTEKKFIPTMYKKCKYVHGEISNANAKFIEIPYLNKDFAMVIILPNEVDGLQLLETSFNLEMLKDAHRSYNEVELYLPRFKLEVKIKLKEILTKIGLSTMFKDNANFDRLSNVPLQVSSVLQKVFIEVNEDGSEAAAATAVKMRLKRMINTPNEFIINRPFMFIIQHIPSSTPLFLGSVRNIEVPPERDEL